jgi:transcriptional regulator with XRE-family HTH domain
MLSKPPVNLERYPASMPKQRAKPIPNETDRQIGLHIRAWLDIRRLNQQFLADRLGVTKGLMSQYVNGKTRLSGTRIRQIAAALDITPSDLLMGPNYGVPAERRAAEAEVMLLLRDASDRRLALVRQLLMEEKPDDPEKVRQD